MKLQVRSRRWVIGACVAAMAVAAAPLPSFAGQAGAPVASKPTLTASIQRAVAVTPLAPARGQAAGATADKSVLGSASFFKSKAGAIALAVVAAGAGYAFYAAKNDRIHSVARKGQ
ncbi:MAG: hypothetical protein AABY89_11885 [Acidobacteriota bacterium]